MADPADQPGGLPTSRRPPAAGRVIGLDRPRRSFLHGSRFRSTSRADICRWFESMQWAQAEQQWPFAIGHIGDGISQVASFSSRGSNLRQARGLGADYPLPRPEGSRVTSAIGRLKPDRRPTDWPLPGEVFVAYRDAIGGSAGFGDEACWGMGADGVISTVGNAFCSEFATCSCWSRTPGNWFPRAGLCSRSRLLGARVAEVVRLRDCVGSDRGVTDHLRGGQATSGRRPASSCRRPIGAAFPSRLKLENLRPEVLEVFRMTLLYQVSNIDRPGGDG